MTSKYIFSFSQVAVHNAIEQLDVAALNTAVHESHLLCCILLHMIRLCDKVYSSIL